MVALLSLPITFFGATIARSGGPIGVGGPVVPADRQLVAAGRDLITQPGRLHPSSLLIAGSG